MTHRPVAAALLPATEAALHRHLADVQAGSRQPSLVAAVVRDGSVVWSAGRGVETGGPPPGPDLQYRIGSVTKPVTAITVLQCRDEGLLDLDAAVGDYVPGAPFGNTSLRRLLAHTGGLPAEPAGPWWERHHDDDLADLFQRTADQARLDAQTGSLHYSNLGYALLGAAVAAVRAEPWADVVTRWVLRPLGMDRTSYAPQPPHAQGWSVHPHTGRLHPEPHSDTGRMAPAGQLWSTSADLARLAGLWTGGESEVLSPASVREMTTGQSAQPGDMTGAYGLGLRVEPAGSGVRVGHSGSMPGFLAGLAAEPGSGLAAVALSNGTAGGTPVLPARLLDQVLADEPAPAPVWRPEPVVEGADELLGPWYWGNTPFSLVVRGGRLRLEGPSPARSSRFVRMSADRWRGLDAYFADETLTVLRDPDGRVQRLELASYLLTRTPQPG